MLDLPVNNIGTLPGLELQIIQDKILLFLFCSIRISAFLISSPIFGAGYVLLPVRILFAMVLIYVRHVCARAILVSLVVLLFVPICQEENFCYYDKSMSS